MEYAYKAMDADGTVRRGRITADDVDQLEHRLRDEGLDLIAYRSVRLPSWFRRTRISRRELIDFCLQLELLAAAGVPLLQGLMDLQEAIDDRELNQVISAVIDRIQQGASLSEALNSFPTVFDVVFINLIRAGERSGQLPAMLRDLTETLKWQDDIAGRARKAVAYPAVVAMVLTALLVFLMTYLVPQLVQFIRSMEGELPLHTRALIAMSEFMVAHGIAMAAFLALMGMGIAAAARHSHPLRLRLAVMSLQVPVIGGIRRNLMLARFARIFALMYQAGVPVLEILHLSVRSATNLAVAQALESAGAAIAQGRGIAQALGETRLIPPLVVRMVAVGEATGALDTALLNVSSFYDRDAKERINRLETLLEPALTSILGLILGWIILSVLGPVYDLVSTVRL